MGLLWATWGAPGSTKDHSKLDFGWNFDVFFKLFWSIRDRSWSSSGTTLGQLLHSFGSFGTAVRSIGGGRGGVGRTDTSHFFLLLKSPSLATAANPSGSGNPSGANTTGGTNPSGGPAPGATPGRPPFPMPLVQIVIPRTPNCCLIMPWPPSSGISYSLITLMPCSPQLVHDTSDGVGNPWGGKSFENPLTNPGFLETQISAKSQGLKTSWQFFAKFLSFRKLV